MVPVRTCNETPSTATKPPNSRVRSSVSRMVSLTPDVSLQLVGTIAAADRTSPGGAQGSRNLCRRLALPWQGARVYCGSSLGNAMLPLRHSVLTNISDPHGFRGEEVTPP